MTDERLAQARAEAERRWPVRNGDDPIDLDHHLRHALFHQGVVWADANPKRMKVSASDFDRVVALRPYSLLAALDQLGIEVENDDE